MTARPFRSGILVLALVLAAGCQQQVVRDGPAGGDATGQLGSPLAGQSPADVYIQLSAAYMQEDNLTESFKNAKKAVMVDPGSSDAFYMEALVYRRLGQMDEAEQSYRKAIKLDPRNPNALNGYGSFLCDQGRHEDADSYFRRALQNPLYSTPWLALNNAAWCREQAGDLAGAERDYRSALQINPRFAPSLLGMARMSYEQASYMSARAYLQRFAEASAHTAESLWLGVRTENQLGDKDQMASYGLKLRSRFPDSEQAKYLQAIE